MGARWIADLAGTKYGSFGVIYSRDVGVSIFANSSYSGITTNVGNTLSSTPAAVSWNTSGFSATDWAVAFGNATANQNVVVEGNTFNTYAQFVGVGSSQLKQASIGLFAFSGAFPSLVGGRSSGATDTDRTAAIGGQNLFKISFQGTDGTAFGEGARIVGTTTGAWSGSNHQCAIRFYVTPSASTTPTLALTINDDGTLTGTTATASQNDNSTKLASTAYVDRAVGNLIVHQVAHGFSVGMPIARNSGAWVQADNTSATKAATAIVISSSGADDFVAQDIGQVTLTTGQWDARTGLSGGLVDGEFYWLGGAGLLTATQPSAGYIQRIGQATSTTVLMLDIGDSFAARTSGSPGMMRVHNNANQTSTGTGMRYPTFNTVDSDTIGIWDAANTKAVIVVSGVYSLFWRVNVNNNANAATTPAFDINGNMTWFQDGTNIHQSASLTIYLNAGDIVKACYYKGTTGTWTQLSAPNDLCEFIICGPM